LLLHLAPWLVARIAIHIQFHNAHFLQTYGYCSSVIGSTIGQPGWYNFFDLPQQGEPGYSTKTTEAISTANGIYSAGGAIGTLFVMWAATALGRKRSIQIGGAFALLGGALQGGAANLR
jgi:MFS family permease